MRIGGLNPGVLCLMTMSMACDLTTFVMPLIVGAMVTQHGLSDAATGFIATAQLLGCALLAFAMVPVVRGLNPRATIALGLVLVALGNAFSLVGHNAPALIAARLSAGFGEALVNVVVGVLMARERDPDAGFAMISIGITSGAVVVFLAAPMLSPRLGQDAIFWILAILPTVALPCLLGIPGGSLAAADRAAHARPPAFVVTPQAIAILVGIVGFGIAGNAVFIFVERIGEGVGVGYPALVRMLLWVTVATAAGPVAARVVGIRFGRVPVLAVAFLGLAIACPMMGAPRSGTELFIGLNIGGFCLLFATPFYSGLMVAMDPAGRLITLSRGVLAIGSAITPSIASLMLLGGGGFPAVGYWSAVTAVVSFGLVWYAARSVGRPAAAAAAPALAPRLD
jgi:predicted MFS family arabinose efflux permease